MKHSSVLLLDLFLSSSGAFVVPNALAPHHDINDRRGFYSSAVPVPCAPLQAASICDPGLLKFASEERYDDKKTKTTTKPTLYDVLGASPKATKAELKLKYVALAKQTHPDVIKVATAGTTAKTKNSSSRWNSNNNNIPEFSEIAAAWRVLSNEKERQRYDRQLQAAVLVQVICVGAEACLGTTITALEVATRLLVAILVPLIPPIIHFFTEVFLSPASGKARATAE